MRVLLLSAYDAESHQHWRNLLVEAFTDVHWTVLTLPSRYFSWRIRGNSLSWAFDKRDVLEQPYDLIIATSMTDLSALRGFVPTLARIPAILYFHENQFVYPSSGKEFKSVEPCILNLYGAISADYVLFNSQFNQDTFLQGCKSLLEKLPDHVPKGVIEHLKEKSSVLPVPLSDDCFTHRSVNEIRWVNRDPVCNRPLRIVWAARWEYDKGPDRLLSILEALEHSEIDYRIAILGQKFRGTPDTFSIMGEKFAHRIDQFGYADSRDEYLSWLNCADIFLSTATHEFQGLSVLEAVALGCIPILPKRQVYPDLFADEYLYPDCEDNLVLEAVKAVEAIEKQWKALQSGLAAVPNVGHFHNEALIPQYESVISEVIKKGR